MDVKEGFKQTEVGVIPEDWDVEYLGEMTIKVGSGITPTGGERVYKKEGRPFLRSQNVGWGLLLMDDIAFIDNYTHNTFKGTEIQSNDVFLNITGASIGRSAVADRRVEGGNVNQHVCIIRTVNNKLNPRLLNLFLLSTVGQKQIDSFQAGGNRQGLNFGQIRSFQIPLPPTKAEQTSIATALGDADALIQSLEKLIAKKRLIKQGAMQELLKPKEGWVVKNLGKVCEIYSGGTPSTSVSSYYGGHISWINSGDLNKGLIDEVDGRITEEGLNSSSAKMIQPDTLLIALYGATSGVSAISKIAAAINQAVLAIIPNKTMNNVFLFYMLSYLKDWIIITYTQGGQPNLSGNIIKSIEITSPGLEEQTRIAAILSDMDAEISALETKLAKYKQVKQGMMQNLLTGRIRLIENASAKQKVIAIDKKPSHNWQINEAVVIAVLTKEFGSDEFPLGRKRYTKLSYLLHRYVERETEGYLKKVAGPYNPSTKYGGPERIAQENKYIKQSRSGQYSGFVPSDNIAQAEEYFHKWYGQNALKWLNQFKYERNDTLELWGTVDMAVQDLKRTGKEVSTNAVKSLINNTEEWKPKLKRPIFSDKNIAMAILKTEELFDG